MARYAFTQTVVAWPGGTDRIQIINGNPRRVILIIASILGANIALADESGSGVPNVFFTGTSLPGANLTYADWGSLIQGEVWMARLSGSATDFAVTEVYKLPC